MAKITITPFNQSILSSLLAANEALCAAYIGRSLQHPARAVSFGNAAHFFLEKLYELEWADKYKLNPNVACTGTIAVGNNKLGAEHFQLSDKGRTHLQTLFKKRLQMTSTWYHPHDCSPCLMSEQAAPPHTVWPTCY